MNQSQYKAFRAVLAQRTEDLIKRCCYRSDTPEIAELRAQINRLNGSLQVLQSEGFQATQSIRERIKARAAELELEAMMGTLDASAIKALEAFSKWDPTSESQEG